MHTTRRLIAIAISMFMMLAVGSTSALAAPATATDYFQGTATTGYGQASPVDVNPADISVRADGAIGLGYTYRATGEAFGELPGSFTYEEHGYLYFTNPANPATFAGSHYAGAAFTLRVKNSGHVITIADKNPAAYRSGTASVPTTQLRPAALTALKKIAGSEFSSVLGKHGITYGYFTFTSDQGTFTGVATPDFRQFLIRVAFSVS
jgi:hypothetical protein